VTIDDDVAKLANHVRSTLGEGPFIRAGGWHHMGAVICDAVLQQARHYERWVLPRVKELQSAWPDARTVTRFRARAAEGELSAVLRTTNRRKLAAIVAITDLLAASGVETRDALRAWLKEDTSRSALLAVHGVGPKTVDYLGSLVGGSHVAVDVHLRAFARQAGVGATTYHGLRRVYEAAADRLGHDRGGLEHAVWNHMSVNGGAQQPAPDP
jgi:endonuclease III